MAWDGMIKGTKGSWGLVAGATVLGVLAWVVIYYLTYPVFGEFGSRALATFVSFFFIPVLLLALTRKGLELKGLDKGFFVCLLAYQLFALWLIVYYWVEPDYFKDYDLFNGEHLLYLAVAGFYVPSVDFFVRRFHHLEVERAADARTGFIVGTAAWVLGHGLEVIWLSELMGLAGSFTFIVASGVVTSLLYTRFKNILGLMAGHWTLNFLVSTVTSALN